MQVINDYCTTYSQCDEDYDDDGQTCCCERSGTDSCHPRTQAVQRDPWDGIERLTYSSVSPYTCQGDCKHDCLSGSSGLSASVYSGSVTLTPTAVAGGGCDCQQFAATATVDSFTTTTAAGSYADGSMLTAVIASNTATQATVTTGGCVYQYTVTRNSLDEDVVAAAVGIWLFLVFLSFAIPMAGIMCCIKSKRELGAQPQPMAWVVCVLILFFSGPCFMWIPFVLDGCYNRPEYGGGPQVTIQYGSQQPAAYGGQQMMAQPQPYMAQAAPVHAQPVMAQATAIPVGGMAVATATAAPIGGQQPPPGFGAQQPPVAAVTAVPMEQPARP